MQFWPKSIHRISISSPRKPGTLAHGATTANNPCQDLEHRKRHIHDARLKVADGNGMTQPMVSDALSGQALVTIGRDGAKASVQARDGQPTCGSFKFKRVLW